MISYEIALELKNAGFPQKREMLISSDTLNESDKWSIYMLNSHIKGKHVTHDFDKPRPSARFTESYHFSDEGKEKTVYIPTLAELIEACKKEGIIFELSGVDGWIAEFNRIISGKGPSPEEAVANLYLALNVKK